MYLLFLFWEALVDGNCPVDCEYYEWSVWSSCSASCDGGVRLRSRLIKTHERYGGKPCNRSSLDGINTSTEKTECNNKSCPPGRIIVLHHVLD